MNARYDTLYLRLRCSGLLRLRNEMKRKQRKEQEGGDVPGLRGRTGTRIH